jgi:DNA (cytosine-5)-methyltransferase 1
MRGAYYNEFDPFAAAWLRRLIKGGLLPEGEVDERSIVDVRGSDLDGFSQRHFFAGIGGWSYALRLAGWAYDREVWTGSPPCQPLSVAGQGKGHVDQRHLWPAFYRLVAERRPATLFGEQVAGKDGREWFAGVRADLEAAGYAVGGAVMPACAVGAPHRRERLFFVADANGRRQRERLQRDGDTPQSEQQASCGNDTYGCDALALADPSGGRCAGSGEGQGQFAGRAEAVGAGDGVVGDAAFELLDGARRAGPRRRPEPANASVWRDAEWIVGADGKARRVKPGVRLLAHGLPARVGRLRGYGNAIVPQLAAEFIRAVMDLLP